MITSKSLKTVCAMLFVSILGCGSDDGGSDNPDPTPEVEVLDPVAVSKINSTKVYMHYMPWFETNESSGNNQWGYHWTMANKNPNNVDGTGKREIASHFYPLIGPYHSGDKDVIEYHLLLMKYAGIDGVLIDWYGRYDVNDYRMIRDNTEALIDVLDEVGIGYAIVYEDRFLQAIVDQGMAPTIESAAKSDMSYMQSNYFNDNAYIQINNKPLLLNFGPITLTTPEQWTETFSVLSPKPSFLTLWYESAEAGDNAQGEFSWVYEDNTHLTNFYNNQFPNLDLAFGSAYPGFDDFYEEGGAEAGIGWSIDHNSGATLTETLSLATGSNAEYLQLITWNDFGEGTMLEPTQEFGYSSLESIKSFAEVQNLPNVFSSIYQLYTLRKAHANNTNIQKQLDQVFYYFVALQVDDALALLQAIED
ncbi:glycoside hydrolase family 71/99-like protein [Mangrovimonas xylaniphaga]|uniref:glycoside hydrolase family 71/99-like protein n=1 Tax=Mangrovimonas xylaniphaga TaxID=1645915 RepID=UPI0006B55C65|nr:glycoside hydrolase family 71/99-like protein [Mangrovimonas xylaniphaga]